MTSSSPESPAVEPIGEGVIGPAKVQWFEVYTVRAELDPAQAPHVAKTFSQHMIFAPAEISATWQRTGGPDNEWVLDQVHAVGPRVNKGGRLGESISERWSSWDRQNRPAWIVAWAEQQTLPA